MSAAEELNATSPTRAELLERARRLAPAIAARRDEADALRDIPPASIAELTEAGLLRVFQPKRWGGYEADPRTFYAIQNAIAEACPSTAWVYGVLAVQSLLVGRLEEAVQAEIWGQDERTLVSSSFAPVGKAERVEGGFVLSGRWSYSSGSSFGKWAMVGGRVEGAPPGPPLPNLFLIPRADYEIKDVWNTFGLRGTGSNDLVAHEIFVPAHRHFVFDSGLQNITTQASRRAPLYRLPWSYLFASVISNFAIGTAREALRAFVELSRTKVSPASGKAMKDDPAVAQAAGRLAAELETAEAMYERHIARQLDYVDRDEAIPVPEAMLIRAQLTSLLRRITGHVDELMLLQGARATDLGSRVTRNWLDLCAARTHLGNDPSTFAGLMGSTLAAGQG